MENIEQNVRTSFYLKHVYSVKLRNIEDNTVIVFYTNTGSPWFNHKAEAEKWLEPQENQRLDSDNLKRPSTKCLFVGFFNVYLKVVLDRQPLVGTGPLPDWLRNLAHSRWMVALDTFNDNLCLWRCIAVHQGANPDRSTAAAKELARSFLKLSALPANLPKTSLDELENVEKHLNREKQFSDCLGIRVFMPERLEDGEVVWHLTPATPVKLTNIMTIGVYDEHAFLIKNNEKLAKTYKCENCHSRFTGIPTSNVTAFLAQEGRL